MCSMLEALKKGKRGIPGIRWFLLQMELEHHWIIYPRYVTAALCQLNETLKALIKSLLATPVGFKLYFFYLDYIYFSS